MKGPVILFSLALFLSLLSGGQGLKAQEVRKGEWVRTTALIFSEFVAEDSYRILISYEVPEDVARNSGLKNPIIHYRISPYPINKIVVIDYKKDEPIIFHCIEKNCLE